MKQFKFLAVALAALTFASCSKDKGADNVPIIKGDPAVLNISFVGDSKSKVEGPAPDATDQKVTEYAIYVFNSGGVLIEGYPKDITVTQGTGAGNDDANNEQNATTNVLGTKKFVVTTAAHSVYVVANAGTSTGTFLTGIATRANLLAKKADIIDDASLFATGKVLMTGGQADLVFKTETNQPTATATFSLAFPVSKITVIYNDTRTNNASPNLLSTPEIAVLYAGKTFPIFSYDLNGGVANTIAVKQDAHVAFYSGLVAYPAFSGVTVAGTDPVTVVDTYLNADNFLANAPAISTSSTAVGYHYYVPANDGLTKPTILTIRNKVGAAGDEGDTYRYYPIRFKSNGDNTSSNLLGDKGPLVVANSYNVTINLSGDIGLGGSQGVASPEEDVVPADLNVEITAASWDATAMIANFQ